MCRYLQLSATYLQLSLDICSYLQAAAAICRYLCLSATYLYLPATDVQPICTYVFNIRNLSAAICNHLQLPALMHNLSIWTHLHLFVNYLYLFIPAMP